MLVRHAESKCSRDGRELLCGWHDVPLSDAGRMQVEQLRRHLAQYTPTAAVYSSPLKRALETAAAAKQSDADSFRELRSLSEIHCGVVEGLPLEDVESKFSDLWTQNLAQVDEAFRWPGGETYSSFRRRVIRTLRAIATQHCGSQVLVFTHAGVISQLLGWINGASAAQWASFRPGNASITRVVAEGDNWTVESFDDRRHLTSAFNCASSHPHDE